MGKVSSTRRFGPGQVQHGAVVQEVLKQASGEPSWGQGWGTGTTSNGGREWRRAEPVCGEMEQLPLGLQNLLSLLSSTVCSLLPSPLSFDFVFYLSISCYLFLLSFSLLPFLHLCLSFSDSLLSPPPYLSPSLCLFFHLSVSFCVSLPLYLCGQVLSLSLDL